jgi:hypothetical protein
MAEAPKGPIQFHLRHVPTGRLLGTYPTTSTALEAKEALERKDPEGAARGDYKVSWSFTFELPEVEPHRFELALFDGTFGPICSVCGLPVDLAPHTNRQEAWDEMMERF